MINWNTISSSFSSSVTPVQWGNHSDFNIAKAEQQKRNSVSLRALVESLLAQTASDMQKQFQATSAAFQFNIKQLKTVKSHMEDQLTKAGLHFVYFHISDDQAHCIEYSKPVYQRSDLFDHRGVTVVSRFPYLPFSSTVPIQLIDSQWRTTKCQPEPWLALGPSILPF